jgi:hypothetical protein
MSKYMIVIKWIPRLLILINLKRLNVKAGIALLKDGKYGWSLLRKELKSSVNPKDVFSKTERKAISVTYEQEPTLPFTPENLEQLYSTCSNPADLKTIFLVIKNEGTDQSPRSITNHEDFKNRSFDELWEWATTPRFSLDRSVKDQLQDRQYG